MGLLGLCCWGLAVFSVQSLEGGTIFPKLLLCFNPVMLYPVWVKIDLTWNSSLTAMYIFIYISDSSLFSGLGPPPALLGYHAASLLLVRVLILRHTFHQGIFSNVRLNPVCQLLGCR